MQFLKECHWFLWQHDDLHLWAEVAFKGWKYLHDDSQKPLLRLISLYFFFAISHSSFKQIVLHWDLVGKRIPEP